MSKAGAKVTSLSPKRKESRGGILNVRTSLIPPRLHRKSPSLPHREQRAPPCQQLGKLPFPSQVLRWDWRGGSAGKVVATQTQGPEFNPHQVWLCGAVGRRKQEFSWAHSPARIGVLRFDEERPSLETKSGEQFEKEASQVKGRHGAGDSLCER